MILHLENSFPSVLNSDAEGRVKISTSGTPSASTWCSRMLVECSRVEGLNFIYAPSIASPIRPRLKVSYVL